MKEDEPKNINLWELPTTWAWTRTGEIATVVGGGTPRTNDPTNFEDGDIPWITPADLSGYSQKKIERGARNITDKGLNTSGATMMPAGTILFSSRAPIGYIAIAANPVSTNQGFKSFVPGAAVTSDFLYYYLQFAKPIARELASGTTFPEISGAKAALIPTPIAPLPEQDRIVAEIEKQFTRLDAATAALKRVQANLKRYRASVLKAACEGRLVPRGPAASMKHAQVVTVLREPLANGRSPRSTEEGSKILRLTAIRNDRIDRTEWRFGELPDSQIESLTIREGDILVSRGNGSKSLVGLAGLATSIDAVSEKVCFPDTMIRIRLDLTQCDPEYFVLVWNSRFVHDQIESTARTTAGIHKISQADIERFQIPLPAIDEQREIAAALGRAWANLQHVEESLVRLQNRAASMRSSILMAAFSGQLLPQDPADEPAFALLERIRAEHASKPKASALTKREEPVYA